VAARGTAELFPDPAAEAREHALSAAVRAYFTPLEEPEPFDASARLEHALAVRRAYSPLKGSTPGEIARLAERLYSHQARELRASHPGLVVDTELRDILRSQGVTRSFGERGSLLRAAQRVNGLREHRVRVCLRYMTRRGPYVDGERVVEVVGAEGSMPGFRGVAVCGNGWVCPVCAARITEARRKEIRRGVQRFRGQGGVVVLTTLTFSHGRQDALAPAWVALGRAIQAYTCSATVKNFRAAMGFAGRIRAREITYGVNGWHPHSHALELYDAALCTAEALEAWRPKLARAWQVAWQRANRFSFERVQETGPSLEHGLDMTLTGTDDYIAKWGTDAELSKWHVKRAQPEPGAEGELGLAGYSPFDLLRIYAGELLDTRLGLNRNRAAALFGEYAAAVKGTAQLHWSRGLKASLRVAELTDVELAAAEDEEPRAVLGTLTASEWFTLVSVNRQVEFLGLVALGGFAWARVFLDHWREELERWRAHGQRFAADERKLRWLWRPRK
jgi:hypothetical protein